MVIVIYMKTELKLIKVGINSDWVYDPSMKKIVEIEKGYF